MAANRREPATFTSTVTLAASATGSSATIPVRGARLVHWGIKGDVAHTLTAVTIGIISSVGKVETIIPASMGTPAGTDSPRMLLNGIGLPTTIDLRTAGGCVVLRPKMGAATSTFGAVPYLAGAELAGINLTKDATVGNAVYTVTATVYYP